MRAGSVRSAGHVELGTHLLSVRRRRGVRPKEKDPARKGRLLLLCEQRSLLDAVVA